jgi:hypothetical protein
LTQHYPCILRPSGLRTDIYIHEEYDGQIVLPIPSPSAGPA